LGAKPLPKEQSDLVAKTEHLLHLNLAACHAKSEAWAKVVADCDRALAIDATSVKALFRRGQAHLRLGDSDRAGADLHAAAKRDPNDPGIKAELQRLQQLQRKEDGEQKAVFAKMFQ
jgi:tetratricopeptide (TPR) repeat protein